MNNTTTLEIDGAQITIDTSALFRAWFEKHLGKAEAQLTTCPMPRAGEKYVGGIIEPDGRLRHIFLLLGDEQKNWNAGMAWAKSIGGDLPDRIEQAMLYAFMPDEFQKVSYWSNTQRVGGAAYAWCQGFGHGGHDRSYEDSKLRVRAVRREYA